MAYRRRLFAINSQRMVIVTPRKKWFKVHIVTEKTVKIYAADEDEAKEKADDKYGPLWTAEDAWVEST